MGKKSDRLYLSETELARVLGVFTSTMVEYGEPLTEDVRDVAIRWSKASKTLP